MATSAKPTREPWRIRDPRGIDWLLYAVGALGGPTKAAKKVGVNRRTIVKWLELGVDSAEHGKLRRLSELAKVPLSMFRTGPPTAANKRHYKKLEASRAAKRAA